MSDHRYILQPYTGRNSRYTCPKCGKANQFSKYFDTETGEVLADNVGRCNRIDKCGYHYTPKQYFANNGIKPEKVEVYTPKHQPPPQPVSYIDTETFKASLKKYDKNNLVKYLHTLYDTEQVNQLVRIYNIGTSAHWNGGTTIFWQVDTNLKVRTGKLIKYNATTGKRTKLTNWVHSVLNIDNFNLKQCLFGEHLLNQFPDKMVGIVESEKTAIIASVFLPDLVWLASGGAENINKEKVKPLRARNVILFPDASMDGKIYQKWKELAEQLGFEVSDYLEQYTNDEQKANGVDIADFLINENKPNKTANVTKIEPEQEPQAVKYNGEALYSHSEHLPQVEAQRIKRKKPQLLWDIAELETFFSMIQLPNEPIKLNDWNTVIDVSKFIESHFATVNANNGKKSFLPYLNRLQKLKRILTINSN